MLDEGCGESVRNLIRFGLDGLERGDGEVWGALVQLGLRSSRRCGLSVRRSVRH